MTERVREDLSKEYPAEYGGGRKRGGGMRKSNCKFCKEGVVLNPKCNKVVSKYYCDIDAYDRETGCANCPYKKESEVRDGETVM